MSARHRTGPAAAAEQSTASSCPLTQQLKLLPRYPISLPVSRVCEQSLCRVACPLCHRHRRSNRHRRCRQQADNLHHCRTQRSTSTWLCACVSSMQTQTQRHLAASRLCRLLRCLNRHRAISPSPSICDAWAQQTRSRPPLQPLASACQHRRAKQAARTTLTAVARRDTRARSASSGASAAQSPDSTAVDNPNKVSRR